MSEETSELPRVPWKGWDVVWSLVLVGAGSLIMVAVLNLAGFDAGESGLATPAITAALEGLMLLAVLTFGIGKYGAPLTALGLRVPYGSRAFLLPWAVLLASLVFTNLYALAMILAGWEQLEPPPMPSSFLGEGLLRVLNVLVIGVWVPFSEEVFFRGFILASLVPRRGIGIGVVTSSVLFALAHGAPGVLVPVFVSGLLLAWLYLKTRSVWPSIMAHSAQNFIALALIGQT